ncbi:hypothetical protein LCGC14_1729490 [marine sediment metagenome]|uniref:Phage portal protein n=1 Tax=marine sediment metagenome TaxID=412755 RepID=A0A0F9JQL4_9ZZZZ
MNLFKAFTKALSAMRHTGASNFLLGFLSRTKFDYAKEVGTGIDSSVVTAPVQWIQRAFTEAWLRVVKRKGDEIEEVVNHDLVALIDTPNPGYSGLDLWSATVFSYLTAGNAYWLKIRNDSGKVVELWYVPHWRMTPKWPENGMEFISHYEYNHGAGTPSKVPPEDVVHFRAGIDPRNTRLGISPIHGAIREIFMDLESSNWVSSLLRNQGVPGLVISPDGETSVAPADVTATKTWFKEAFTGDRRGAPLIMGGKTKVEQYGFNPQQMDLSVVRDVAEERVCSCLGIPAAIVGFGAGLQSTKVGATMNEMRKLAWINGIIPIHRSFADTLQRSLMPDFMRGQSNNEVVEFDTSQVTALEEDMNLRATRWNTLIVGGWALVSDGRRAMGLDVTPADEVYLRGLATIEVPAGASMALPINQDAKGNVIPLLAYQRGGQKSDHSPTEERLALRRSHKPTQAQARFVAMMARQQPGLVELFERRLIAFFEKMGRDVAAVALPILQETFKASAEDMIIVERILGGASMEVSEAVLRETYEAVYLEVAKSSGEAAEALGLSTGLPDPVARAVVSAGGRRAGLIDMTERAKTSLFNAIAEGRAAGEGADALARRVRVDIERGRYRDVQTRAKVIARTETAFAQSTSTIERSREAGVQQAMVFDNRTGFDDDICSAMDGITVTLDEAQALAADEHPNGTRSFSPLIQADQQE